MTLKAYNFQLCAIENFIINFPHKGNKELLLLNIYHFLLINLLNIFFRNKIRKKRKNIDGFSLIELIVVVAVLSILASIGIPSFNCFTNRAKATAAFTAIQQIKKECIENSSSNKDQDTFTNPGDLNGYSINTSNPNNCDGVSGFIQLNSFDTSVLPTIIYETSTDEITYFFRGVNNNVFKNCLSLICGEGQSISSSIGINDFQSRFENLVNEGNTLENRYYRKENSIYVIVKGDTWEEAQAQAKNLGGNLATINDEEESNWLSEKLYGDDKASKKLTDKLGLPGEPLRGAAIWLGHTNLDNSGEYKSITGEKDIFDNWALFEKQDGLRKGEKYTVFNLYENSQRNAGQVSTVFNRQLNTQELRERGGAHIFYGLAEIKINPNKDVNEDQLGN